MAIRNPHPGENEIATPIYLNTVINGNQLNPPEAFEVTNLDVMNSSFINDFNITEIKDGTVKLIHLSDLANTGNRRFYYKMYLPQWNGGNTIWIVPAFEDRNFEDNVRDYTTLEGDSSINNISDSVGVINISENSSPGLNTELTIGNYEGISWIEAVNQFMDNLKTDPLRIRASFKGIDTNRSDEIEDIEIRITTSIFGA